MTTKNRKRPQPKNLEEVLHLALGCWFDFLNQLYKFDFRKIPSEDILWIFHHTKFHDLKNATALIMILRRTRDVTSEILDFGKRSNNLHVSMSAKIHLREKSATDIYENFVADLMSADKSLTNLKTLRIKPDPQYRALVDLAMIKSRRNC